MGRIGPLILSLIVLPGACWGVSARNIANVANANNPNAAYNYSYMYPYLNNQMRTDLNPGGVSPSLESNPIDVIVTTKQLPNTTQRNVVPRSSKSARAATTTATTAARAATGVASRGVATTGKSGATTAARAATTSKTNANSGRRVVARAGTNVATRGVATNARAAAMAPSAALITSQTPAISVSSTRCLADYIECMNGYCQRENTAYNRCYCSSRLAQIDAQYQPAIDSLIRQILVLRGSGQWSDAEMNEYWMETIGKYTGGNSWQRLEDALNIDWAATESRVRGQQAFATGHEYCSQHLSNCFYMAGNMRDAYRSEIARDCATYEASLQRLKNAAESLVESYEE